jgi:hypothetical protein
VALSAPTEGSSVQRGIQLPDPERSGYRSLAYISGLVLFIGRAAEEEALPKAAELCTYIGQGIE